MTLDHSTERALAHDWTGVFVSPSKEGVRAGANYAVLTACHHPDNAFYQLGVVRHEITWDQLRAYLPEAAPHDCQTADICWILDFYTPDGLVDDREVTEEQATDLLGHDARAVLAVGRTNYAAWVAG